MAVNQSIFRQKALEHYQQVQMPRTLPRFTSPLTIFWYWILFLIFVVAVFSIWSLNTLVLEQGTGVMRILTASELKSNQLAVNGQSERSIAVVLFPAQALDTLHTGNAVSMQIAGSSQPMTGKVEQVNAQTLTADEIRQKYGVTTSAALASAQPQTIVVAFVGFGEKVVPKVQDGARITASYQAGTIAVLPLLLKTISMGGTQ